MDVKDAMDAAVDDRREIKFYYQIANYNEPGTYWNDIERVITDTSDMVMSMIQNYS